MYPVKTEKDYDSRMIKASYETIGWGWKPPQEWEFELDKTSTKLVRKKGGR